MIKTKALCSAAILGLVATLFAGCGDGDNTLTKICQPNAATCSNESNSGQICSGDGTRLIDFSCADGEVCNDGACEAQCTAGAQRCASEAAAQVCSEDGTEWIPVACAPGTACEGEDGCVPTDEGVQVCDPEGAPVCADGSTVKTCDADGSSWIYRTCDSDEMCDGGECVFDADTVCEPRATQCVEGSSARCNDEGSAWVVTECPDSAPCKDGVCQGTICEPGATKCADLPNLYNYYGSLGTWEDYEFGALFTCNEAGDGWVQTACDAGQYCTYDNISPQEINAYVEGLIAFYRGSGVFTDPPTIDLSDSMASCTTPECPAPHEYRRLLSQVNYGYYGTGATSFCGTPDMPAGPADGDYGANLTKCEGLPPFSNLTWATYECQDHETCAVGYYGDQWGAVCRSSCTPGEVTCAANDSISVCDENGEWGPAEQCPTDGDYGYEYVCQYIQDFQGGVMATCIDPVCSYWMDYSNTMVVPAGYGACTPDGQFRECNAEGTLEDAVDCDGYCEEWSSDGGFYGAYNAANQDPGYCAFECEDGQEQCLFSESTNSPLYRVCDGGTWSTTIETCADNALCWDGQSNSTDDTYSYAYQSQQLDAVICGGECNPGNQICDGPQVVTCNEDGQWEEPVDCDAGQCEEYDGFIQCEMKCIPGQVECYTDGYGFERVCDENGLWGDYVACDTSTLNFEESCRIDSAGVHLGCVQCIGTATNGNAYQVADTECFSLNETRTCGANNEWETEESCGDDVCYTQTNGYSTVAWCGPAL